MGSFCAFIMQYYKNQKTEQKQYIICVLHMNVITSLNELDLVSYTANFLCETGNFAEA